VSPQLRSELLKQRSTQTNLGLLAGTLVLVLLAVLLHGFGVRAEDLGRRDNQLMVLGRGEFLAAVFTALLGALSITSEIRQGTIRPTFLVSPRRGRVVAAKVWTGTLIAPVSAWRPRRSRLRPAPPCFVLAGSTSSWTAATTRC
jgi:ABC-2 type transport system permease protein